LRDADRAAGDLRRAGEHDLRARHRHPRYLCAFRRRLLPRAGLAVGRADRGAAADRRRARLAPARTHPATGATGVRDFIFGSGVSASAGSTGRVRHPAPHRQLRAAVGLFVQPRRLDDVLHLRDPVPGAGLRHHADAGSADHPVRPADRDHQGCGRRAARRARGGRGDAALFRDPRRRHRTGDRGRPRARHGALGDQRGRQLGRCGRRREVGKPERAATGFRRFVAHPIPVTPTRRAIAMPTIAYLECSRCHAHLPADTPQTVCTQCPDQPAGALYVRYDLSHLRGISPLDAVGNGDSPWRGMWRYHAVLPAVEPVTLGEGWTPMLPSRRNSNALLKEEGANPTGTFKARGLAMAVTMARHYRLNKLAIPSAGNAAGALAAYAAAAGIEAHIFMPRDVPIANFVEVSAYGAHVTLVDGVISDCARMLGERQQQEGWFDVSTLKEPFRVEGKKTMGYELVEQLGWEYPDAVFYPTGGGVGMIGMWKAFEELEQLGWVKPGRRPRMFGVQSSGCAPVVKAFDDGAAAS